ncbi:MAG: hypothetical protein ACMZ64_09040 [Oleiphilus sp.]
MKFNKLNFNTFASTSVLLSAAVLTACGGGSSSSDSSGPATGTEAYVDANLALKGDFTEDVTLIAGQTYQIDGEVNFLEGTTLTIPAGTTLYGASGSSYLAINRGAMIDARGTASNPIIFTSAQDIAGTAEQNDQGQWGGLTLLGQSTNNKGERTYEAGTQLYGPKDETTIENDSSGTLQYVVIKYSGFEIETDKELNGLSLGSVGSGTTIENIAIIGSADDGIELWGGTVDVDGLYIYNAGDDSIDTDQGYIGTLSNVYVQQVVVDDETDSRAIEADSHSTAEAGTPQAHPTLVNATLDSIGRAVRLREGTGYTFDNVQINVKSSSADPASASYAEDIAAIRVSDNSITGDAITIAAGGLGIKNDAVELTINATDTGSIGADGIITSGLGIYRDSATLDDFRALSNVKETVGVSGDMVDEAYLDSSDTAFAAEVAADNTVTGVDLSIFEWALEVVNDQPVVVLSGDITTDTTLTSSNLYAITGEVNVIGAELTIEPGTTLFGASGNSYLAINRGATINAAGTAAEPIIFTSAQDVAGLNTGDEQGQWGGLTILGQSTNNKGERTYEAGTQLYGPAGGVTIDADNSGTLTYVAIKYSGYEVEKDKELNGLSLGSVGSGTTINNIAIIGSADDGIELWGGTVSVDGLYIYNAGDDSIDTDQGYVGTLSNVYAEQNIVDDEVGSRVIEADSHSTGTAGTPVATPTLQNAILKSVGRAVRLREGTNYVFDNVQITVESSSDASVEAIRVSDTGIGTGATVSGSGLAVKNNVNSTALFTTGSAAEFGGLAVLSDDDTTLTITEYDASWAE